MTIEFRQSLRCPRVIQAEGYVHCQVCNEARAVGHMEVADGPFQGRLVMLTCEACGHPENQERALKMLAYHVADGYLDKDTGGPGWAGSAPLVHNDHIDTLDDWRQEHDA